MAKKMLPPATPQMKLVDVQAVLSKHGITDKVAVVGVRGYFENTMGEKGKNDRGIYDDAIGIVTPTCFLMVNANVDPSAWRPGIACLKPGVWRYKVGIHGLSKPKARQYQAFVQAATVTVARDGAAGKAPKDDTGWFGINIHRGGVNTTSSLGCQTIPPAQWEHFRSTLVAELKRHEQKTFPYVLVLG